MIAKIRMPKLSANIEEATITAWLKNEGDKVRKEEPIAEVTTDKTAFEFESPKAGTLRRIVAPVKSNVPVHYVIALIGSASDPLPDVDPENKTLMTEHRARAETSRKTQPKKRSSGPRARVRATPAARRLARELGIDLTDVAAAGDSEIVSEEMVRTAAKP
ncbi:MAG: E3 binding domain-containing protein [Verrucomicrobia bacterium]|nr:E3 binding domain-containing protein [Verrucomicrobiota bacterium]MDA1086011.1 E3 binding domain-containing protein [Verrucomicrobiota bacterium]